MGDAHITRNITLATPFADVAREVNTHLKHGDIWNARWAVEKSMGYITAEPGDPIEVRALLPKATGQGMAAKDAALRFLLAQAVVAEALDMATKPRSNGMQCIENAFWMTSNVFKSQLPGSKEAGLLMAGLIRLRNPQKANIGMDANEAATRAIYIVRTNDLIAKYAP